MSGLKLSEPDCFETPDVPISTGVLRDSRQPDAPLHSEDIEESSISSAELFKRFSGKELDTSKQDYDSVRIGKPLKQSEFSFNPTGRNTESALERFNRLRAEVEALANDLKSVEQESPELEIEQGNKASDIARQLENLQNILDQCERTLHNSGGSGTSSASVAMHLMNELQHPPQGEDRSGSSRVMYELYCSPSDGNQDQSQLASLEKRLSALESGVGSSKDLQKPISITIELLEEKISLLDENKLSLVETKLSSLVDTLAKVPPSSGEMDKIDSLFDMMSKWDSTSQQVPVVIERLVSLKGIHEQSVSAVNSINQIQNDQSAVADLLRNTTSSFQQLENAFEENKKIIQQNVSSLENRMKAIEEQLSRF